MKTILQIPFAGSPASGKSTTMKSLKTMIDPNSPAAVHFIPEIANAVLRDMPKEVAKQNDPLIQQHYIHRCQLLFEEAFRADCARADRDFHLIITDRGAADSFVYLNERDARVVSGCMSADELLSRYSAVLFFELSPDAREKFLTDRSTARAEKDFDEVIELDKRSLEVWGRHKNLFRIRYQDTPEDKAVFAARTLNGIVGGRVFGV